MAMSFEKMGRHLFSIDRGPRRWEEHIQQKGVIPALEESLRNVDRIRDRLIDHLFEIAKIDQPPSS
jgi:hypothetical protein